MPTYGHGMYATPSVDGWRHGIREMNGYRAAITIYGDGLARGWNEYGIYILDYVTGITRYIDGKAQYPDIRTRGIAAMRNGRRDGIPGNIATDHIW